MTVLAADRFEEHRPRLRAIAYRMLGSAAETDDVVQETWLRASRADAADVRDLGAWLATILGRICLNLLRQRRAHPEDELPDGTLPGTLPDPLVTAPSAGPELRAEAAEQVGFALLTAMQALSPDERVAFVLHDAFEVPFAQIAEVLGSSADAARQNASRARRRLRDAPTPDPDPAAQRRVVEAFYAAAGDGDFEALLAVLHPDAVLRSDGGSARPGVTTVLRGGRAIASSAVTFAALAPYRLPADINGAAGAIVAVDGRVVSLMAFTVSGGTIAEIDVLADPERLAALGVPAVLAALEGWAP